MRAKYRPQNDSKHGIKYYDYGKSQTLYGLSGENPLKPQIGRRNRPRKRKENKMSLFKKSDEGFLTKLFKHKEVDKLAEELAHTYAEEMLSESEQNAFNEDEKINLSMLEVTEKGEVDFDEQPKNVEGESPPQGSEQSEIRKHIITFRVNDLELETINRRYAETSFKSRGDFCRYSALTVMNVEENVDDIKQIARHISSASNSFNQVAHRTNRTGKIYDEDISEMKKGLNEIWQLLVSIRSTKERTTQLIISATQTKPQTANMLLATCAYLLHKEHLSNSEIQENTSAQDVAETKHST
jgi:hypothetical protein